MQSGFILTLTGSLLFSFTSRYLRKVHVQYCVPSNVSSGLATRPLSYVYVNGTPDTSRKTNMSLPTGEILDGKKSYKDIVSFFTTNSMTPDKIHHLGIKMLGELYPQVSGSKKEKPEKPYHLSFEIIICTRSLNLRS